MIFTFVFLTDLHNLMTLECLNWEEIFPILHCCFYSLLYDSHGPTERSQPVLKCMANYGSLLSLCAGRSKQRELHLECEAPEGCHKHSSLPEVHTSIHTVSTTIHQSVSPQPWLTHCWLVNQWDWPSLSVSAAWGGSSPSWCNEMLADSG